MQRHMDRSRKFKMILATLLLWGGSAIYLVLQSQSVHQNQMAIEELGNRADELRSSLYFSEPFRALQVDDIALDIQVIYSLRIQVENSFKSNLFLPDVNQLLYVTDRFLEDTREFLSIEMKVKNLAQSLSDARDKAGNSEQVVNLYNELSAYTFQALYAESQSNSEVYRAFDRILIASEDLDQDERKEIQVRLSNASVLLSEYAEVNFYVEKLIEHSVHDQLSLLEDKLHDVQRLFLILALVLSFVALLIFAFISSFISTVATQGKNVSCSTSESTEPSEDVVVKTEESVSPADSFEEELNSPIIVEDTQRPVTEMTSVELVKNTQGDDSSSKEGKVIDDEATEATTSPNHQSVINIDAMLATMNGDEESVAMLLDVFIQDHADDAMALRELLDTDLDAAQRKAHSLKGVAGSLGAMPLRDIATDIEATLKQSKPISEVQLGALSEALADAISATKEYLSSIKI